MLPSGRVEASKKVIEDTMNLYSAILTRPPKADQLIRPTFKFIQDLVKSLITETRTLRDVFNPSDFDTTKKVWDRRAKTEFIQRLVDHSAKNGQPVIGCVAAKVVSGMEPNKTNELLQALARLAQMRLNGYTAPNSRPRTFVRKSSSQTEQRPLHNEANRTRESLVKRKPAETGSIRPVTDDYSMNGSSRRHKIDSGRLGSGSRRELIGKNSNQGETSDVGGRGETSSDNQIEAEHEKVHTKQGKGSSDQNQASSSNQIYSKEIANTSESEIGNNIPLLRNGFRQLKATLDNLNQFDEGFDRFLSIN